MPSILDIGLGRVGSNRYNIPIPNWPHLTTNSHPIHPATVHLPIAFLLIAAWLDLVAYSSMYSPLLANSIANISGIFFDIATPAAVIYHLSLFSYVSTVLGTITAFPAITSGLFEAYTMISAKGLDITDPVIKTILIHAGLNDLAILGGVYNVFNKWGHVAFAPKGGNALVSVMMLGGVAYAAFLGGGLVYSHGVGVQRMGKGKEEKEEGMPAEKAKARKEL